MKKIKLLGLSMGVLLACSTSVLADGNAFTPLNFDDVSYSPNQTVASVSTKSAPATTTAAPQSVEDISGNSNMQNAILQLDNAQVEVRNELLNYKTKYSEIDAQYKQVKAERQSMQKLVKSTEKRIKQLDKAKENIRKNMI